MLTEDRGYNFVAELTLNKSRVLAEQSQPSDDKVNWLVLNVGERQFSFVYKIEKPLEAEYGRPFRADIAITMIEIAASIVELNHPYEVLRGQEIIGTARLIKPLM